MQQISCSSIALNSSRRYVELEFIKFMILMMYLAARTPPDYNCIESRRQDTLKINYFRCILRHRMYVVELFHILLRMLCLHLIWDKKFKFLSIVTPRHLQLSTTDMGLLFSFISFNTQMTLSFVKIIRQHFSGWAVREILF